MPYRFDSAVSFVSIVILIAGPMRQPKNPTPGGWRWARSEWLPRRNVWSRVLVQLRADFTLYPHPLALVPSPAAGLFPFAVVLGTLHISLDYLLRFGRWDANSQSGGDDGG
jgi:hypothetical protein